MPRRPGMLTTVGQFEPTFREDQQMPESLSVSCAGFR